MAHLLENDRDGYRRLVQNERDDRGRHLPGYYHTVTLGPRRIEAAFPSHELPKEVKHYYPREAAGMPDSEPLAHPTGENTKAKALEVTVVAYLQLVGENIVEPGAGSLERVPEAVDERGSLRATEVAKLLNVEELPMPAS